MPLFLENIIMLRFAVVIACLSLSSCSKTTKSDTCATGTTDPRTGQCVSSVDPNAASIASMQARLEAQTQQIQLMIQQDQQKQIEIMNLRNILNNPQSTQSQKDAAVQKLGDLGIAVGVHAAAKGGQAVLTWLDKVLGLDPNQPLTQLPQATPTPIPGHTYNPYYQPRGP